MGDPDLVIQKAVSEDTILNFSFGDYTQNKDDWTELYKKIQSIIMKTVKKIRIGYPIGADTPIEIKMIQEALEKAKTRSFRLFLLEKLSDLDIYQKEKQTLQKLGCDSFVSYEESFQGDCFKDAIQISDQCVTKLKLLKKRDIPLSSTIGNLSELKSLTLRKINSKELPKEIGQLTNLKMLYISDCKIESIPKEIGLLTNLKKLIISDCELKSIPEELGNLSNLEFLMIYKTEIDSLPISIGNLKQIQHLNLTQNRLKSLPNEIGNLKNADHINLNYNQLKSLPLTIGALVNLKYLYLAHNTPEELPSEIGNLHNLEELSLSHNKITELPPTIEALSKLKELDLGKNHLNELPLEIGQLKQLNRLYLDENNLTSLPSIIGCLKNLRKLDVTKNPLVGLPEEITNLFGLKYLSVDDNVKVLFEAKEKCSPDMNKFQSLVKKATERLNIAENDFKTKFQDDRDKINYILEVVGQLHQDWYLKKSVSLDYYLKILKSLKLISLLFYSEDIMMNMQIYQKKYGILPGETKKFKLDKSEVDYWNDLVMSAIRYREEPRFLKRRDVSSLISLIKETSTEYLQERERVPYGIYCRACLIQLIAHMISLSIYVTENLK
ncbi:MAG: leucine-rich repeat domain-containing protein [Candidatus Hodarchaeota archaeon]